MSPEYVMEGRFSEKSDVFSFGVLLLEIISGRKNTSFYGDEEALSLLGYAWKLWNQGNIAALVDPGISYPSFHEEIFRCVHVGLLCVQEFAKDRPAIFTVISMLKSEIVDLPTPKQPAFSERLSESFQHDPRPEPINNVTPVNDSSGILTISEDGNLVVLNDQKEILWSSEVSIGINDSRAQLMDSGNLVLGGSENGNSLWQSFHEPSDTYMPKMKLPANSRTGKKTLLTSWTSVSDPSIGNISGGIDPSRIPEIPEMSSNLADRSLEWSDAGNGTLTLSLGFANESSISNYILSSEGKFGKVLWDDSEGSWRYEWQFPKGGCGPFGSCDARDSPICSCLKGFEPKNADEWNNGNCNVKEHKMVVKWARKTASVDTITSSQYIKDPEAIVSAGNKFKLGFFSPVNSTNRYVAIWYSNISITTPVWVANRNKPLNDSSGIMKISEDGNLVVLNGQKEVVWSSNVSIGINDSRAQLMDSGNLVLGGSEKGNSLWESFQEPSNTYIPKMRLAANLRTGKKTLLRSWKRVSDPSIGSFSAGIDPSGIPQFLIWNGRRPIWRSGLWNGTVFIGIPEMNSVYLDGFALARDGNGVFTLSLDFTDDSFITNFVLSSDGKFGQCLSDCSCIAYAYDNGIPCMLWRGNLTDIKNFSSGGADLYIRLAYTEFDNKEINLKLIISLTVVGGAIAIAISVFYSWRWIAEYRERKRKSKVLLSKTKGGYPLSSDENIIQDNLNRVKLQDLPVFNLLMLSAATDNFDISNKLGQGGFGPVYKGVLPDGQEIALKRLSRASGQGQDEFMTEVEVISKLQHMNLVRLLGCCVEGEEKLLVYEYMPNKSLDAFLFDPSRKQLLVWKKRVNIVEGICRGLLYLHRDSRLQIIHRDLKAGNILLDQELNPKISDFGMARIFCRNEDQANTRRVVGTYGYMSPEYAWKLWNQGNIAALVDPGISYPSLHEEIFRCVHVGLLCVQEFAKDRPAIFTVISMLKTSVDTITSSQHIKDPEAIVSAGNKFKLGFFSPVNSTNRYVAIWYSNIPITTPVWVANRNKPLNDSSGIIKISENGNLVVLNGQKEVVWSSNVTIGINDSRAQLMDNGNLVLGGNENGSSLWESFQEPSNTCIPKMRIAANPKTGKKKLLRSWKSPSDPSIGSFSAGINPSRIPEIVVWNGSRPIWRSGPWNGVVFIGLPEKNSTYLYGINLGLDSKGSFTLDLGLADDSFITNLVLSSEGQFGQASWDDRDWKEGYWSYQWATAKDEGNLTDIKQFSSGGADLYIRLAYTELDNKKKNLKVIISLTVVGGAIAIAISVFYSWRWIAEYKERKRKNKQVFLSKTKAGYPLSSDENIIQDNFNRVKLQELPMFNLQMLSAATDNFDISNKLGQGGFGPVYKGVLPDGQEIALKRLSRASGQGQDEFMTEVVVISKLNHMNLVRLLGCCVEGEEKLLVYEYMPNKSLDAFLFDPSRKQLLDWKKRVNIVEGICRGLLYLHRDSRLRIIHRDLKAGNILLDQELNPKISDFGMARIFGRNEDQANTRRVVGTYGYMSPEYAMEGRFSEKSDVFSFGVLLLEIISGRKNTSFYGNEEALSLLGYAWKLWNQGNIAALVDPGISYPSFQEEIFRCVHVGLLCVQEFAKDRPAIFTVISMLKSEIVDLPTPKQPAFSERRSESFQHDSRPESINNVTFIRDNETIVSSGNKFKLGFFSPVNSTNRYVAIWYSNISITTPVWVANRNKPLNDSSGIMKISEDGNLVVLNGQKEVVWSSNVSIGINNSRAQLMDSGNLVLGGSENGNSLWESFQEPSNTYIPKMRLAANLRTGKKTLLRSWKSVSDPSIGSFSAGIDPSGIPQFLIWNGSRPIWRSGPWNNQVFIGVPEMNSVYLDGFNLADDGNGGFTLSLGFADESDISNFGNLDRDYGMIGTRDHGTING
uniref:non-specific serine/threonine protein kinase n=1 Tax=Salix viminalis TaxID=40686 RepID=A0A6N2KFU8_SALVM